jgi:hypothetical protein
LQQLWVLLLPALFLFFQIYSPVRRKSINLAIESANNHYAGFGPGTANIFRKMVGLPEVVWSNGDEDKDKKEEDDKSHLRGNSSSIQDPKQSTLSDFTT